MTTNDARRLDDEPAAAPTVEATPSVGTESLTSPVLPATAPTTTSLELDDSSGLDVTADLHVAVELANEIVVTLERNSAVGSEGQEPGDEADAADLLPPPQPLQVWVDAGAVLAELGVDGWAEFDQLDEQARTLHDELGPQHERTRSAIDDRDAVGALVQQDEKAYQEALETAVHEVARERHLDVEVLPVRMAQPGAADSRVASTVADLHTAAVRRATLPQLRRPPLDLPPDGVAAAVKAAGRTYLERIETAERPVPDDGHDQLEEKLPTEPQHPRALS